MKSLRTDPNLHRHQECIEKWNMEIFSCLPKISPFLANSVTRYSMLLVSITCGCRNHTWGLVGKAKKAKKHPKESLFLWFSPKAVEVLPHTWNCHNPPMRANKIIKSFTEKNPPVQKSFQISGRFQGILGLFQQPQRDISAPAEPVRGQELCEFDFAFYSWTGLKVPRDCSQIKANLGDNLKAILKINSFIKCIFNQDWRSEHHPTTTIPSGADLQTLLNILNLSSATFVWCHSFRRDIIK